MVFRFILFNDLVNVDDTQWCGHVGDEPFLLFLVIVVSVNEY